MRGQPGEREGEAGRQGLLRLMCPVINVLFLCTHNSARSVLAEAILTARGAGKLMGHSAGSFPSGRVNPFALEHVRALGLDPHQFRSKSWDEFAQASAPRIDYVITVCDNAAGEACPVWPGKPISAHWGIPDPAAEQGDDTSKRAAFKLAFTRLSTRIDRFCALPLAGMDRLAVKTALDAIGQVCD